MINLQAFLRTLHVVVIITVYLFLNFLFYHSSLLAVFVLKFFYMLQNNVLCQCSYWKTGLSLHLQSKSLLTLNIAWHK